MHNRSGALLGRRSVLTVAGGLGSVGLLARTRRAQEATPSAEDDGSAPDPDMVGQVIVDGSSTVWPVVAEVAERLPDHFARDIEVGGRA